MKQLTQAEFHDFESSPIFVGTFTGGKMERGEDDKKDKTKKKGDLMGYYFESEDGTEEIVGASSTVESVMEPNEEALAKGKEPVAKGTIIGFRFKGKGETATGRPFNKFAITAFDDFKEANEFYSKKD
jgi:hypothetical protein